MSTVPRPLEIGSRVVLLSPREAEPETSLRHRWDVVTVVDPEPTWGHLPTDDPASVRVLTNIDGTRYLARGTTVAGGGTNVLVGVYDPAADLSWAVPVNPLRIHPLSLLEAHGLTATDAFTPRPQETTG